MASALLTAVNNYIADQGGGQGLFPTRIDGFNIIRSFETMMPMRAIYRPSLCVVLQGGKEIHVGDRRLDYGAMDCLVVSVELPAMGRIVEASPDAPYIGVVIDFDVAMVRDVLEKMAEPPAPAEESGPCMFVGRVDETLGNAVLRLLRMTASPQSIPILYPSLMREICYWLVSGPHGGELRKLVFPGSTIERVARAVAALHRNFTRSVRIEQLAELAGMSPSSFHQHFKALTSMTPLQFQKQLRLLEARRLMVSEAATVSDAAYRVGYESVSHFSREYSRCFGIAPKQDALNQQRLYNNYANRTVRTA